MPHPAKEAVPVTADPLESGLEAWRHWVAAALLPAAVHRLNNGRYILMGLAEQMLSDGPSERAAAYALLRAEGERDRALTDLLARLALPQRDGVRETATEDLCVSLKEPLVGLYSLFRSVRSVCVPAQLAVDALQAQVALIGLAVTFAQLSGLARSHRSSDKSKVPGDLAFHAGPGSLAVEFTAAALPAAPAQLPPLPLAEIEEHLRSLARSWSSELTLTLTSVMWRAAFDFSGGGEVCGVEPIADEPARRGRILLVMEEASVAGPIETVLSDCGYVIECATRLGSDPGPLARFDLVLWEAPSGDHREQLRSLTRLGARIAILGDDPSDNVPSLASPPRPRDLVAFVDGVLDSA